MRSLLAPCEDAPNLLFCSLLADAGVPTLRSKIPSITSPDAKARSIVELTSDAALVETALDSRLATELAVAWPIRDDAPEVVDRVEVTLAARLLVPLTLELAVPEVERVAEAANRELLVVATREAVPVDVVRVRDVVVPDVRPIVDDARDVVPPLDDDELLTWLDTREAADGAPDVERLNDEEFDTREMLDAAEPVAA